MIELAKQAGLVFINTTSAGELLGGNTIAHDRFLKFGELVAAYASAARVQPSAPEPTTDELRTFLLNHIKTRSPHGHQIEWLELAHNEVWVLRQMIDANATREQDLLAEIAAHNRVHDKRGARIIELEAREQQQQVSWATWQAFVDREQQLVDALQAYVDFAALRRTELGSLSPEMEAVDAKARTALAPGSAA